MNVLSMTFARTGRKLHVRKTSTLLASGAISAGMLFPAVAFAEAAPDPVDVKHTFCTDNLDHSVAMTVTAAPGMFADNKIATPEQFSPVNEEGLYCITYVETIEAETEPIYADITSSGASKVTIKIEQVVVEPAGSLSFGSLGSGETETLKVIGEAEGDTFASVRINY
ncbi:hypothetical protein [Rhodococcus triatomae]